MNTHMTIELNDVTYATLHDLMNLNDLDASTVINRAVQMLHKMDAHQRRGDTFWVNPVGDPEHLLSFRWE